MSWEGRSEMSLSVKPPKVANTVKKELKLRQHAIGFEKTTFDSADYFANGDNSEPTDQSSAMPQPDNAFQSVALFSDPAPNTYHGVSMLLGKMQEQAKQDNPSHKEETVNRTGRRVPELNWHDPADIVAAQSTKAMLQGLSYEKRKKYHELRKQPKLKLFDSADYFLTLNAVENIEKVGFDPKSLALKDLGDEATTDETLSEKKDKELSPIKQSEKLQKRSGLNAAEEPKKYEVNVHPPASQTKQTVVTPVDSPEKVPSKIAAGLTFQSIDTPEKVLPSKAKPAGDGSNKQDPQHNQTKTFSPQIARTFEEEKQKPPKELPPTRKQDPKQSGRSLAERQGGSRDLRTQQTNAPGTGQPEGNTSRSQSVVTPYFSMCHYQSGELKSPVIDQQPQNMPTIVFTQESLHTSEKDKFQIVVNAEVETVSEADSMQMEVKKKDLVKQNTAKSLSRIDEATKKQECGSEYPQTVNKNSQIACESMEDSLKLTASVVKVLEDASSLSGSKHPSEHPRSLPQRGQVTQVYQNQAEKGAAQMKSIPSAPLVDPVATKPTKTDNRSSDVLMRTQVPQEMESPHQTKPRMDETGGDGKPQAAAKKQQIAPKKASSSSSNNLSEDNGAGSDSESVEADSQSVAKSLVGPRRPGLEELANIRKNNPRLLFANRRHDEKIVFDSGDHFLNDNLSECSFQGEPESSDGEFQYSSLGVQSPVGKSPMNAASKYRR